MPRFERILQEGLQRWPEKKIAGNIDGDAGMKWTVPSQDAAFHSPGRGGNRHGDLAHQLLALLIEADDRVLRIKRPSTCRFGWSGPPAPVWMKR